MEGRSPFPVVLLAPGSLRLAGSQRGADGELLGEPERPSTTLFLPAEMPLPGLASLAVLPLLYVMSL